MSFRKVIYENVKKTHSFQSKYIYMYGSQTFWSFMKFYFAHFVKVCFVFKNSHYAYIPLCLHKTLPTLENEKKDNSKLNFRKNGRASWFSCGRLKILKWSISLARLGEGSKSKVTPK